jgi:ATP-binding cassette subfamily F protein 3
MALAQFEGTLIVVSHDRHLLRATTDQFMLVANHRLQPFEGDLDEYRDWLLKHAAEKRDALKAAARPDGVAPMPGSAPGDAPVNRKEQRRAEAEARQRTGHLRKPLQNRIGNIEAEMDKLNGEKATLDAFVADPANYEPAMKAQLTITLKRQADVSARLTELETQWLTLHEELEQL